MIKLTDFKTDKSTVSCKIYPEGSSASGALVIEKENGDILDYSLPQNYEWCINHVDHAARELFRLSTDDTFPCEKIIYWY